MPQTDYNAVLKQLETGIIQLATTSLSEYAKDAQSDGLKMLETLKADIQNWTIELTNGDITAHNLEYLVTAKKDLIVMGSLKQAGLAAIRIDQFKNSAIQLIVSTLTGLIKV